MMKKGGHTLLIDGNYFLHSRLFVLPRPSNGKMMEDEESRANLMRKLAIDLASEVRKMRDFIDKVVVTVDARSWRKDLFPQAEYKGTRKPDSKIDWTGVYDIYGEFQTILQKHGVIVHRIDGAEADDVLFGWSTYLNNKGKNCIIWTGDRDLIQLVNYSIPNDAYTLWYSSAHKSLYAFENFEEVINKEEEEIDKEDMLFNMASHYKGLSQESRRALKTWMINNKVKLTEVNCDEFLFKKILVGDSGDNIPSVITWQKEMKNGKLRTYSVTDRMADKIFEQFTKESDKFVVDSLFVRSELERMAESVYRVVGRESVDIITSRIFNNMSLMLLHTRIIPEPIQNEIYKAVEREFALLDRMDLSKLTNKDKILENTKWLEIKNSRNAGIFSTLDTKEKPKKLKLIDKNNNNKLF